MASFIQRRPWSDFAFQSSATHMKPRAQDIHPDELVNMASYRHHDRAKLGKDVLQACVAYAQDNMVYDEDGCPHPVNALTYAATPMEQRLNKIGKAYREDACLWLHQTMADIVVDAALFLHRKHGWTSVIYDGLRTVDAAYRLYEQTDDDILASGLFSTPGLSAHNKGMAADVVMFDSDGRLVDMGGNFDHLDMATNSRTCRDLPLDVIGNRLKREIGFQHAALMHGRLLAPLRSEFWDDRFPENAEDHWRVLDSIARCMGKTLLSEEDETNRRAPKESEERNTFYQTWEQMDYGAFRQKWQELFDEEKMRYIFDLPAQVKLPPDDATVIYHGDFNPLYDRNLVASNKHLTDNTLDRTLKEQDF